MLKTQFIAALSLAISCPAAFACGDCVDNKISSVYDHEVVNRALASKHQVMFFAIDGRITSTPGERRVLEHVVANTPGVETGTARVSTEAAALSVAIDPERTPVAAVERSLRNTMARRSLTLQLLRVMSGSRF